jgi:hypothetical protein
LDDGSSRRRIVVVESLDELLTRQAGVVSRRQVRERGLRDHDIARRLRHRDWAIVHAGVYVDHTGAPTWLQLAWAAVLYAWPAALSHGSAIRVVEGPSRREGGVEPVHIVVDQARTLVSPVGVQIHRGRDLDGRVQWHRSPPRVRYDDAVIDVAASAGDELAAIATLAQAVSSRRTTATRLALTVGQRQRLRRGRWMRAVIQDIADGTCSVLEHGYRHKVERAHRLPSARLQVRGVGRGGAVYRDAAYAAQAVVIELDGRLGHDDARGRDRDFDRDLSALLDGQLTVRLSYGQVFTRPCWTAGRVAALLQQRGWAGEPTPCGPGCALWE